MILYRQSYVHSYLTSETISIFKVWYLEYYNDSISLLQHRTSRAIQFTKSVYVMRLLFCTVSAFRNSMTGLKRRIQYNWSEEKKIILNVWVILVASIQCAWCWGTTILTTGLGLGPNCSSLPVTFKSVSNVDGESTGWFVEENKDHNAVIWRHLNHRPYIMYGERCMMFLLKLLLRVLGTFIFYKWK